MASAAEENAHLIYKLKERLGAIGFDAISNFFETEARWCCPCCFRAKGQIARLDKNGNLCCALVYHHDHFEDYAKDQFVRPRFDQNWHGHCALEDSFARFPHTLICQDCNTADTHAKEICGAPKYFSFAPHEITAFIEVEECVSHRINRVRAVEVYDAAKPAMGIQAKRLRSVLGANRPEEDNWKSIGGLGWGILKEVNIKRKQAGQK